MKTIILISFCLLPCIAYGQFDKGQIYLGGTLSTSINSSPSASNFSSNNSFGISPNINFFLNTRFSLGGAVGYSYTKYQYFNLGTTGPVNTISFSPTVRYYLTISNSFYLAFQGQISYSHSNPPYQPITPMPDNSYGINFSPIFIFFPVPKWGIEGTIGSISFTKAHYAETSSYNNNFSLNAGSFSFGVAYYFKRK